MTAGQLATPTLMRAARGVYAGAIRARLTELGIEDLPRNGALLLAGIDEPLDDDARRDLGSALGVTRQAISQALDILVERGYVTRGPDPQDRRRNALALTERGRIVLSALAEAVESIDNELAQRISHERIEAMRDGLLALSQIKTENVATGAGLPRPRAQMRSFSPTFPVRDLTAALAHYAKLGFRTYAYDDGADYGFADRDGVGLHFAAHPDHDPKRTAASAYLYVRDADALHAEWTQPGIGGRTRAVSPTDYGLREGAHIDPDGNLIRFGSPIA